MKNLKFLVILSLAITVFSCKKSEDAVVELLNSDLIGTWNMTAVTGTATGNATDVNGTMSPFTGVLTGRDITSTVTFTADNVTTTGTFGMDLVVTATNGGGMVTFPYNDNKFVDVDGTWTRVGTVLTTVAGTDTTIYTATINGNSMTLASSGPLALMDTNATGTGTINATATFTKQ